MRTTIHKLWSTLWLFVVLVLIPPAALPGTKNGFELDGALVPENEIKKGGPPRDGIPSLDRPKFIGADDARYLKGKDRVLGVFRNGEGRAYPIRILNYHEIVNDVVAGEPVAITYCPLCGSGTAVAAEIDGRTFEFGVSGLLYNSDVLMYDRQTGSLWSQLMNQSISGPMKGRRLSMIPVSHTTWREWTSRYPETKVLSNKTGYRRNYKVNPYPNYGRDSKLYFPVANSSSLYRRKEIVMGVEIDGKFKAFPFRELKRGASKFADHFAGQDIQIEYDAKNETARALNADGSEIPTTMAFWFAWYAFHPDTAVYNAAEQ